MYLRAVLGGTIGADIRVEFRAETGRPLPSIACGILARNANALGRV